MIHEYCAGKMRENGPKADIEAYGRLVAARAARVIAQRGLEPGDEPVKIELIGRDGEVLFQADIGGGP